MKKSVKRLKGYIILKLPYRVMTVVVAEYTILTLILFGLLTVLCFPDKPIPYNHGNTTDFMYLDFYDYYPTVDDYYFIEDNEYIYIYYNNSSVDLSLKTRIEGVPMEIDDETLEKMLPDFQKLYSHLEVTNIDEMTDYTGYYVLDATVPPYVHSIKFMSIIIVFELFIFMILGIYIYCVRHKYQRDLEKIVLKNEHEGIIQGLYQPMYRYNSLKVALLKDYFVCNHYYPFAIRYDDIAWIYIDKKPLFLALGTDLRIFIYDKNYRKKKILVSASLWRKNKKEIEELFEQLPHMNHQMLVGYNEENIRKFEQMKKGIKQNDA